MPCTQAPTPPTHYPNNSTDSYFTEILLHSCKLSRFCRVYPGFFSLYRIPPGLLTCNRISKNSYINPNNFFQELLHKLATHLTTTTTESCTVMHSQQVRVEIGQILEIEYLLLGPRNAKYLIPRTTKGVNNY